MQNIGLFFDWHLYKAGLHLRCTSRAVKRLLGSVSKEVMWRFLSFRWLMGVLPLGACSVVYWAMRQVREHPSVLG